MSTTDRITAYLATGRNADLPELVRRWIGEGEGVGQDEITGIAIKERDECSHGCDCCESIKTTHVAAVYLAESENWQANLAGLFLCGDCAREWEAAADAIEARS